MAGPLAGMFGGFKAQDENQFRRWYVPMARKLGIDQNPDAPEHHYDNRGFYRAMKRGEAKSPDRPGGHFPSTFKTEGHPRTYLDDGTGKVFDTRTATYLDGSPVPYDRLRASEQSPDMPGFVPPAQGGLPRQYTGPIDWLFNAPPAQPTPSFRDPSMEAGPAPPTGRAPLAQMFKDKR